MKFAALVVGLTLALTGCGKPGLAEECETAAAPDECEENLVCAPSGGEKPSCQTQCNNASDCGKNEDCVGVDGSDQTATVRSCRPRVGL